MLAPMRPSPIIPSCIASLQSSSASLDLYGRDRERRLEAIAWLDQRRRAGDERVRRRRHRLDGGERLARRRVDLGVRIIGAEPDLDVEPLATEHERPVAAEAEEVVVGAVAQDDRLRPLLV